MQWVEYAFAAILIGTAAFQLWAATTRGRIRARGVGWITRSDYPASFQLLVGFNALVMALGLLLAIVAAWSTLRPQPFAERAAELYPSKAADEEVSGRVVVACTVTPTYGLRDCEVIESSPPGYHFGEAALKIARAMTLPEKDRAKGRPGEVVRVPIRFKMPED